MFKNINLESIHKLLVSGALRKGWGGPICRKALDLQTHVIESSIWLFIAFLLFKYNDMMKKLNLLYHNIDIDMKGNKHKMIPTVRLIELYVSIICFVLFSQVVYYKYNISSLINLLQPCHMILLLQGIILYVDNIYSIMLTLFILPTLIGTLLAMLFPDTSGLDQKFEMQAYWIQHYFIQSLPIYLLLRRNSLALKYANFFTSPFCGLWILLLLHFSLYEVSKI